MDDLDSILLKYKAMVDNELSNRPLIDSKNHNTSNQINLGDIYVGCASKWIYSRNKLVGHRLKYKISLFKSPINLSAAEFSTKIMDGVLLTSDVAEDFKQFSSEYFGLYGSYGDDFYYANTYNAMRSNEDPIPDSNATYLSTAEEISRKHRQFQMGNAEWNSKKTYYEEIQLKETEKTEAGWLKAVLDLNLDQ